MDALIASQTIFYVVSSVAIIVLGIALFYALYQMIQILRNTRDISEDLGLTYARAKRYFKKIISFISAKDK